MFVPFVGGTFSTVLLRRRVTPHHLQLCVSPPPVDHRPPSTARRTVSLGWSHGPRTDRPHLHPHRRLGRASGSPPPRCSSPTGPTSSSPPAAGVGRPGRRRARSAGDRRRGRQRRPDRPRPAHRGGAGPFGRLDGVLISVGGPPAGPILDRTEDEWRWAFESGLPRRDPARGAVAEELGEGGSIAFVLSTSAKSPIPASASRTVCGPVWRWRPRTLPTSWDRGASGSTPCCPGRIDTERVQYLDAQSGDPAAARAAAEGTIPLRRYGSPRVRPGRGVPAVAGGELPDRGHAPGRRWTDPQPMSSSKGLAAVGADALHDIDHPALRSP